MKTGLTNVYRPAQDLNGRQVFASPATPLPPSEWGKSHTYSIWPIIFMLCMSVDTLNMTALPFFRSPMVLWWSLSYVSADLYTYQMTGQFLNNAVRIGFGLVLRAFGFPLYPQTTVRLTGSFCPTPTATASASHPSTLIQRTLWWTSTLMPSPIQSLTTNMPSSTSLTQATQVWKLFS